MQSFMRLLNVLMRLLEQVAAQVVAAQEEVADFLNSPEVALQVGSMARGDVTYAAALVSDKRHKEIQKHCELD